MVAYCFGTIITAATFLENAVKQTNNIKTLLHFRHKSPFLCSQRLRSLQKIAKCQDLAAVEERPFTADGIP